MIWKAVDVSSSAPGQQKGRSKRPLFRITNIQLRNSSPSAVSVSQFTAGHLGITCRRRAPALPIASNVIKLAGVQQLAWRKY